MFTTTSIYSSLIYLIEEKEIPTYGGVVAPWSLIPVLFVVFGLIGCGLFYFLGKWLSTVKKSQKWADVYIIINGVTFLILEIVHEVSQYFTLGYYDFSSFPFQFCTMPLYFCLFLPFIRNEEKRKPFIYFLSLYCLISGAIPLFLGQSALCRWQSVSLVARSFIWHLLILNLALFFIGFYHIGTNFKKEKFYFLQSFLVFASVTLIAQGLNLTLHYNGGMDFIAPYDSNLGVAIKSVDNINYRDPDSASLFYISPFFRSNMVVFADIWLVCGWFINYILYLLSFTLGAFGILGIIFLNRKICSKIVLKIKSKRRLKYE